MDPNQFKALLDAFGARPSNWPDDRRASAEVYLAANESARTLLAQYESFDNALDRYQVSIDTQSMRSRILAQLPAQRQDPINRFINWLLPDRDRPLRLWRPVMAATLPLVVGVVLGSTVSIGTSYTADTWEDEIYILGLAVDDTEVLP